MNVNHFEFIYRVFRFSPEICFLDLQKKTTYKFRSKDLGRDFSPMMVRFDYHVIGNTSKLK